MILPDLLKSMDGHGHLRPYKKNDQAWIEQKNGAIVRRYLGYHRYSGAKVKKKYHAPQTPCSRLINDPRVSAETKEVLRTENLLRHKVAKFPGVILNS